MKTLGQIGFEEFEQCRVELGIPRIAWAFLPNADQEAWERVAGAIEAEVKHRMGPEE